jgi:long-chain fatty acid transport protein
MFRHSLSSAVLCLALTGLASAAGFNIYEMGAAATAQAGAYTARSSDATAVFYNPAGIAGQKSSFVLGTTIITMNMEFQGDDPFPGKGYTVSAEDGIFYPSHIYYVTPFSKLENGDEVTFGLGITTHFGLGTEWPADFLGRGSSIMVEIQTFSFNPVLAYKHDNLRVAAGVQSFFSTVDVVKNSLTSLETNWIDVAKVTLEGSNSITTLGWGYNLGLQYDVHEMVTIGASYRSEVKVEYEGDATFESIPGAYGHALFQSALGTADTSVTTDVETEIANPAIMSIGIAIRPIEKLTIEVDVVQMNWSCFDELELAFPDEKYAAFTETIPEQYEDARSYRIGAEYMVTPEMAVRLGYLFDESPAPAAAVSTLLPDADRNSYMVGLGYDFGSVVVDVSYMYLPFNDRSTEQSSHRGFDGLYSTTAHLFGLTLGYAF